MTATAIAYLIIGLITFAGIWSEIHIVDRHRYGLSDLVGVPAALALTAVCWLPLFVWAFTGGRKNRR